MTWTGQHHRPLWSGLRIQSGTQGRYAIGREGAGTLTGLATRKSDGKKMLVTNMHVMAGKGANGTIRNPSGNEEMYQGSLTRNNKVGSLPTWDPENPAWLPVPTEQAQTLAADVAMCELKGDVGADFILHDHPNHTSRKVIEGVVDPVDDDENPMTLTMLGAATGEHTVTVEEVGLKDDFLGVDFEGVIRLQSSGATSDGDSGAPCFYEVREGVYQLACIVFSHNFLRNTTVYAFPASVAQRELGITFGKRAPTASASASPLSPASGATVTLDGSRSRDPEGDSLTYRWEQTPGAGSGRVELKNADKAVATFTMPSGPAALTFKLTVSDSLGQTGTDTATVVANRPPLANAGPDRTVDTGARVNLKGSGTDPDREDALTYRWEQMTSPPTVNLGGSTSAAAWFTAPSYATTLTFRLTVSDGDASDTDTVTVRVQAPETWGAWRNTGRYRGSGRNRNAQQSRTSSRGRTQTRWVDDPEPETWGSWSRTGRTRGSAQNREAEESRTSSYSNRQTRWVDDPEPETWGSWTDTGRVRVRTGPAPSYDRIYQKEQQRTSSYNSRQTRWVETGRN